MQKKVLAIVMTGLVVAGCAPATFQGVREKNEGKITFDVPMSYQATYRAVMANARGCWQGTTDVRGDLYTDIQAGEITVSVSGGGMTNVPLAIDIKAIEAAKTNVTVFAGYSTWRPMINAVRAWFETGSKECRA